MEENLILEKATVKSRKIANDFLSYYTGKKQYGKVIKEISEKFTDNFETINTEIYYEIIEYYEKIAKSSTKKKYAESFFKYLYAFDLLEAEIGKEYVYIFGNKDKIIKDFKARKQNDKKEKKKMGPIYTFQEIEKLQEYCKEVEEATDFESYGNLKAAFAFYLLFYLGITKEAFTKCKMSDYHDGKLFIDGKDIEVPKLYQSMFSYAKEKNKDTKFTEVNNWITRLGKELEIDNLTPKRILMARKEYVFICPVCQEEYLSLSDNWNVINGKIICSACAHKLIENDEKKNSKSELGSYQIEVLEKQEKEKIKIQIWSYKKLNTELKKICNFETWNKYLEMIGQIGEKFVYSMEVQKLLDAGNDKLAELVDPSVALDHKNGFDILSFTETGKKIYIEVKATAGDLTEPFYISNNELKKADELRSKGEIYRIYRVYNVGKENIAYEIIEDISQYKREEVLYKISFTDN